MANAEKKNQAVAFWALCQAAVPMFVFNWSSIGRLCFVLPTRRDQGLKCLARAGAPRGLLPGSDHPGCSVLKTVKRAAETRGRRDHTPYSHLLFRYIGVLEFPKTTPRQTIALGSTLSRPSTMAIPDDNNDSSPDEALITLWARLWSCTRAEALARIDATRKIMAFRSAEKSAAKDMKWEQVASMWEPQGIGRLEWEHWVQTGSFGADVEVFGVRGLSRGERGSESSGEASEEDDGHSGEDLVTGDSFSTSTDASPSNSAPPPSPASPPYQHNSLSTDDSIDEEIFQATLVIVDEYGVERGGVIAKAVWTALRDHLDRGHIPDGECPASCLVCKFIRDKFDKIRDEHGSCMNRRESPDWSTTANASESPRSTIDASLAAQAEVEVDVGPHELDASQTSARSFDDNALPPSERIALTTATPVVFAPPRCVTYRSYQTPQASRAIVFDPSTSNASLHPHRATIVPVSARSRSAPCLSQHPIHSPLSPLLLSPPAGTVDTPLVSPGTSIPNGNTNFTHNTNNTPTKPSRLHALLRSGKKLLDLPLPLFPRNGRPGARSAPVSPATPFTIGSPVPPGAAAAMQEASSSSGGGRRRFSSFALPFSPRPRERFDLFEPLFSPTTVDVERDEQAKTRAPFWPRQERECEWECEEQGQERCKSKSGAVDPPRLSLDLHLRDFPHDQRQPHRGRGGERGRADARRAWSSVVAGSTASARRWARRGAQRLGGGSVSGCGVGIGGEQDDLEVFPRLGGGDVGGKGEEEGEGRGGGGGGVVDAEGRTHAAVAATGAAKERERERERGREEQSQKNQTRRIDNITTTTTTATGPTPQPSRPFDQFNDPPLPPLPRTPRIAPRLSLCLLPTRMDLDLDMGLDTDTERGMQMEGNVGTSTASRARRDKGEGEGKKRCLD
ncbi:uncharacterized protein IWZ02DRAFT_103614 [Phyllosticta citriasiana]